VLDVDKDVNENVGVWVRGWVKCGCGVDEGQGVSDEKSDHYRGVLALTSSAAF